MRWGWNPGHRIEIFSLSEREEREREREHESAPPHPDPRENEELILSTMLTTTAMSAMTGKAKGALGCRVGTASSGVRSTTVCRHMRRSQNPATLNNKRREAVVRGYPAYQEEPEQEPKRWPDEDFVAEVMEKFPDAGVADIEEGRVRQKTRDTKTPDKTPEGPIHHHR